MSTDLGFIPVASGERYFISYKTEDAERVGEIARCLNNLGVPMWYDEGIKGGMEWEKKISKEIAECDAMVLFATRELFLDERTFVNTEYKWADKLGKSIYVIWLDDIDAKKDILHEWGAWYTKLDKLHSVKAKNKSENEIALEAIKTYKLIIDTEKYLEYAFGLLRQGEYFAAEKFLNTFLEWDLKNPKAYLGMLMLEQKVQQEAELANCSKPFDDNLYYQNAIKYGDSSLQSRLREYNEDIKDRNEKKRRKRIYNDAIAIMQEANVAKDYEKAADMFAAVESYGDAQGLARECREKAEVARRVEKVYIGKMEVLKRRIWEQQKRISDYMFQRIMGFLILLIIGLPLLLVWGIPLILGHNQSNEAGTEINVLTTERTDESDTDSSNEMPEQYYTFGAYEQDGDESNGKEPIEWLVLEKEEDRILLVSRYLLDCKPYNDKLESVSWETCTLRSWLNKDFLDKAFSAKEQSKIDSVDTSADNNHGNDTIDKIFLLSTQQVKVYFESDFARKCKPTKYAESQGAKAWWWLRSPGGINDHAAVAGDDGVVNEPGGDVNFSSVSVRPALWLHR